VFQRTNINGQVEIGRSRISFHQRFALSFFKTKVSNKADFTYILGFLLFWHKNIGAKAARKMLVKLTTGWTACY
jgi:hypothetical protein